MDNKKIRVIYREFIHKLLIKQLSDDELWLVIMSIATFNVIFWDAKLYNFNMAIIIKFFPKLAKRLINKWVVKWFRIKEL